MPAYGPYSKEIVLARPDKRTREGRLLTQMRRTLTAQLGGKPTPQQQMLIERCAMLQLRCAVLDKRIIDGTFTQYDSNTYLAFSNSLRLSLTALGLGASDAAETVHYPLMAAD